MTALDTLLSALQARAGQDYLTEFVAYTNALTAAVNGVGAGLVATSTTSVAVGTGSKSFTIQTDKNFSAGGYVTAYVTADPTVTMAGPVASYDADTGALELTIPTDGTTGSGTYAAWTLVASGARGPQGSTGGISGGTLTGNISAADTYRFTDLPAPSDIDDAISERRGIDLAYFLANAS